MDTGRPRWRSRVWAVAVIVLVVLTVVIAGIGVDSPASGAIVLATTIVVAASIVVWSQLRTRAQRRRYEDELAAWASERATLAERRRIAADLHDLVSHGLGLITVRAAAARALAGPDGDEERIDALADIETASRETTTELRRMLTVLQEPGAAPLRPADTLAALPAIIDTARSAGLDVDLEAEDLGDVSSGVQLAICAVVRESLNNSLRHAGPTHARIGVRREAGAILVEVDDDGPRDAWRPRPGAGHGLNGLRERLHAMGGTLRIVADPPGFRVIARLPDGRSA